MADYGATYTDKTIIKLDKEIQAVYKEAEKDIQKKMDDFNAKYKIKEQKYQQKVDSGQMTQGEFDNWKKGQVFQGQQWQAKKDQILNTIHHSNEIATKIINGQSQNVFMTNTNYMSYDIEHGAGVNFGFGLYDQNTVANLIKNDPKLLPEWKINEKKDYVWSQKKLNNSITQGIIQGESLDKIANRLSHKLSSLNENKMKTFARTAMTGAQNSGRQMQLENAQNLGIDLEKQWMSTLDAHTRDSHKGMDGETVPVKEEFSNNLMYPGDPDGDASEVYNCRCTMVSDVKKYPAAYKRYDNVGGKPIDNISYREWENTKKNILNGKLKLDTGFGGLKKQPIEITHGYTNTSDASRLNNALRRGQDVSNYQEVIDRLDTNMEKAPEDIEIYREINVRNMVESVLHAHPTANNFEALKEASIGLKFSDKGYMSCYYEPTGNTYGSAKMVINAQKGTDVLLTSNDAEKEIILGRNQEWEVVDLKMEDGKFVFYITNSKRK